ncbi:MAG: L-histidine N(alpha)-methyltransferase [Bryobacteraceae bacterium]
MLISTPDSTSATEAFAADVRTGLTRGGQKELPSKYLYDALGSKLFEAICELPEYGLTRADERLLQAHAGRIAARLPGPAIVCELGSGSGRKTRYVLEAMARRDPVRYMPIEISPEALSLCERELADIANVAFAGIAREYLDGLAEAAAGRAPVERMLVLFLGSTLGNFTPPEDGAFLASVRRFLEPGDAMLLGTDLRKPAPIFIRAYDDPLGVTAAFNLNLLARINRELDAGFDLAQFRHEATFNETSSSVEMHLRSLRRQSVDIAAAQCTIEFNDGETIWTENSHKYTLGEVERIVNAAGFEISAQWVDRAWPFAETLLEAA